MRVGPDASPEALVELPGNFDPMWMDEGDVWGVWTDEFDVHYVRRYVLEPTGRTSTTPAWVTERTTIEPPVGEARDSALRLLKQASKTAAVVQEIWYSEHFTYTRDFAAALAEPDIEFTEGAEAQVLAAHSRGHKIITTFAGLDAICGLAYGNEFFSGIATGAIICGNEDEPTWWDKEGWDSKADHDPAAGTKGH